MKWWDALGGIVAAGTIAGAIASLAVWYVRQSISHAMARFELRLRSWLEEDFLTRNEARPMFERAEARCEGVERELDQMRLAQRNL